MGLTAPGHEPALHCACMKVCMPLAAAEGVLGCTETLTLRDTATHSCHLDSVWF